MDLWLGSNQDDQDDHLRRPERPSIDQTPRPGVGPSNQYGAHRATIERTADDPATAARLARIASLLRAYPHPGLVELVDDAPGRLSLRRIRGPDLAHARQLRTEEAAGLGAALATTLADLHDLGITHRAIRPEHVLIDPAGRPILCGLGQAQRRARRDPDHRAAARADTAALASMLLQLAGSRPGSLSRVLTRAREIGGRACGCRRLAEQLARATPNPRLPEQPWPEPGANEPSLDSRAPAPPSEPATPLARWRQHQGPARLGRPRRAATSQRRRRGAAWLAATIVALVVAGSLVAWRENGSSGSRVSSASREAITCPRLDRSCRPLRHAGTVIDVNGREFSLGQVGDVVVLGDWDCRPPATPALLRPGTGTIWLFRDWAGLDRPVGGQFLARVRGASSLRVRPGSAGCDALVVLRRHARSLLVRPRRRR